MAAFAAPLLFSLLSAVAGVAQPDVGRVITVGREGCDTRLLQEAVHRAGPDNNTIVLMDPVHTEAGIIVDRDVTIRGFGAGKTILQAAAAVKEAKERVLIIRQGVRATVSSLTIRHGNPITPHRCGGGIQNFGDLTLEDCDIRDNTAVYGVGIWNNGKLHMTRCCVSGNRSLPRTTAEISNASGCTGSGGGIKNEPSAELVCHECTIFGNSARSRGGGLFVSCESKVRLVNCTVSGNESRYEGGGLSIRGDAQLVHCTIARNKSSRHGGGIHNLGRLDLAACLIAENQLADFVSGAGGGFYGQGQVGLNEHNFVADGTLAGCLSGDPLLEPLADNGGGILTHALRPGSPAADVIPVELLSVQQDQRGLPRGAKQDAAAGGGDIGAFERQQADR